MAITYIKAKQLERSTTPGSVFVTDASDIPVILAPSTGADRILFYDHSGTEMNWLTLGTNLSITGTTINASAGAGGYSTIQEEGSDLATQTKINFVGSGITAANDAGNSRTNVTLDTFLNTLATQGDVDLTADVDGLLPFANIADLAALSVFGRGSNTSGVGAAIAASADDTVLRRSGTSIAFGAINLSGSNATTGSLPAIKGGTGNTSYTVGDILSADTTTTLSKIAAVATGSVLKSAGTSTLPVWGTLASTELSDTSNIAYINGTHTISGTYTFSNNVTLNGTPSAGTDAVNKTYVDNLIAGLRKGSVRVATTAAGTLATSFEAGDTIDGITLVAGDLILVKDQASAAENGVRVVQSSGAPTRATWMDAASEVDGVMVVVEDGTTNAGTVWITVSEVTTLDTDDIDFTQITTSGTITGSGANNQVSVWSGTSSQDGSATFTWSGTQLTVGTATAATNTVVTTQGTGTGSSTYGILHQNSSAAQVFRVADDGTTRIGSSSNVLQLTHNTITNLAENITVAALQTVTMQSGGSAQTGTNLVIDGTRTITSGAFINAGVTGTFNPTSGTGTYTGVSITNTVNQTGGASGNTYGIFIQPTLTAAADYRGIYVNAGSHYSLFSAAGKVRLDLGSDDEGDLLTRDASGNLAPLAAGSTSGYVLTSNGASSAPSWQAPSSTGAFTVGYVTGSGTTTYDLDAGVVVLDVDGSAFAFTVPTDLDKVVVYRNGILLSRSGTVSRDYTLVSGTGVLTLASALTSDETLTLYRLD